ncbi:uncharacterized protein ISCGN_018853 [Ixodes scapularis]
MSAGQPSSQVDRPTYHLEPEHVPSGTRPSPRQAHEVAESSEDDSTFKEGISDMDDSEGSQDWTESRGKKRRRKSGGSGTSGTTSHRLLEEGFTVLFAPTNSDSVASLSPSKLTEYVECAAPGAVKEVRVNKARNLIAVEARTPKLKGVLLDLKVLCTTPVRAFLPSPPNTCIGLIRDVELGLSDADIRNQIRAPVKIWDVRRLGEKSKLVKIVFLGKTRPDSLLYGLVRTPVLPFKVKALQCRRCLRYGHISAVCNRPQACARCGASHDGGCESPEPKCINCRQSHEATSSSCPTRRREVAISRYRSENNATFRDAREALRNSSSAKSDKNSRSEQGSTPSDKNVPQDARPSPTDTHAPAVSSPTCQETDATPGTSLSASSTTVKQTWAETVKSSKPSKGRDTRASRQGAPVPPSSGHTEAAAPFSPHPFKSIVTMIFGAVRDLIHILPTSSFRGGAVEVAGLVDSLRTRITDPVVICGDWNAHHALWGDTREDARGRMLAEQFGEHNLVVANDGSPTFFRPPCTFSAIDVTAHSPEIPLSWRVAADTMGSDHFPVFIDIIGLQRPGVHEISVIHWDRFRDNLGRSTRPLLEAISDAAKEATIKASVPTSFPAPDLTLLNLCAARRRAQRLLQRKGGVTFKTLFNRIDAALRRYAKKCFKRQWDLICSSVDATTPARRIWRLMDSLSGKRMYSLPFASLALCTGKLQAALAEDFATLYAAAVSQPKPRCHADKTPFCMDAPFTESELRSALRASKRRGAPGPDGVTTQMLQNLPDSRLQELLSSFNDIWASSESPAVWRLAWVVPVLKSGKPAGDLSSYRPVSLTSCVAKLFERLVHARLIWWLEEHNLLPSNITGFRSRLSAQDSILDIVSAVQHAAASRKSTVAAFFDIQAAFDNVEPASVLAQLTSWGITGRVQGFLEGFLSDRSIQVKLSNTLSQSRPVQRGLPQGSVLSPLLFNIAIAGLPAALPNSRIPIGISMYADDLCIWEAGGQGNRWEDDEEKTRGRLPLSYCGKIGDKESEGRSFLVSSVYRKATRGAVRDEVADTHRSGGGHPFVKNRGVDVRESGQCFWGHRLKPGAGSFPLAAHEFCGEEGRTSASSFRAVKLGCPAMIGAAEPLNS